MFVMTETKQIPLTKGQFAVVDAADYEFLSQWKWHADRDAATCYAVRSVSIGDGRQAAISMHRVLLGLDDPKIKGDHIDGDGLNNTRANLRIATHVENCRNQRLSRNNSSGYKGVSWRKGNKAWMAYIKFNKKQICLGFYSSPESAAHAYDFAAIALCCEFARLNFPTPA